MTKRLDFSVRRKVGHVTVGGQFVHHTNGDLNDDGVQVAEVAADSHSIALKQRSQVVARLSSSLDYDTDGFSAVLRAANTGAQVLRDFLARRPSLAAGAI
jgi:hypothetical protein